MNKCTCLECMFFDTDCTSVSSRLFRSPYVPDCNALLLFLSASVISHPDHRCRVELCVDVSLSSSACTSSLASTMSLSLSLRELACQSQVQWNSLPLTHLGMQAAASPSRWRTFRCVLRTVISARCSESAGSSWENLADTRFERGTGIIWSTSKADTY